MIMSLLNFSQQLEGREKKSSVAFKFVIWAEIVIIAAQRGGLWE